MNLDKFIELLKEIKSNNSDKIIIFCGAGVSKKSGLPGFKEFEVFFEKGQLDRELFEKNTNKLMIFWRNLLSKINYNDNHTKIIRVADRGYIDKIITSNYDLLFEECISNEFPYWCSETTIKQRSIKKDYLNGKKSLIKIHGDVEQTKTENIHLGLVSGEKIEDAEKEWNKIFSGDNKKKLWVIGYRGKATDNAVKLFKKAIQNNKIEKIYWMHRKKDESGQSELNSIVKNIGEGNIELIEIESANKALININEGLFGNGFDDKNSDNKDTPDISSVKKSYEIAERTIKLLEKIDYKILDDMQKAEEDFGSILATGDKISYKDSKLYVLRRYNSYTPILPRKNADSKGGGYFLTHKGKGIVIDPGYDFLENFLWNEYDKKEKKYFRLNHINAIIITHAHNDHYGDFDSIQNMIYQYNKRIKLNKKLSKTFKYILKNVDMLCEEDKSWLVVKIKEEIMIVTEDNPKHKESQKVLDLLECCVNKSMSHIEETKSILSEYINQVEKEEEINIDLFLSRSVYKAINGLIPLNHNSFRSVNILNPGDSREWNDIKIKAIRAKHEDLYSNDSAIGLILKLKLNDDKKFEIGFTGDTGYFIGLEENFLECDVLIPHIGSIKPKEIKIYEKNQLYSKENSNKSDGCNIIKLDKELNKRYLIPKNSKERIETAFYSNHLGILGMNTLLASIISQSQKLKVVVISEYGEEMNTFRHEITKVLNEIYNDLKIITGDIGLEINFNKVIDGEFKINEIVKQEISTTIEYEY